MSGTHDDFVDDHDRDRSAGDSIDGYRIGIPGAAHHHALVSTDTGIPGVEIMQPLLRNADQQDGLVVFQHIGVQNHPVGVHQDQHVDRFAGVGRDVDYIDTFKGIAEYGADAIHQRAHPIFTFGFGNDRCLGEELLDALVNERLVSGKGWSQRQGGKHQHHGQQYSADNRGNSRQHHGKAFHIRGVFIFCVPSVHKTRSVSNSCQICWAVTGSHHRAEGTQQ